MGIFTRFRDIVNANINAILDGAEDPEKMIRLMIGEMEDTLVEIKSSCAAVMANRKKVERETGVVRARAEDWEEKARLAVEKARDDLARKALIEKRRYSQRMASLEDESRELNALVDKYREDMRQLEDKLRTAREKQRVLVQRHIHARRREHMEQEIRRIDSSQAILRFDEFENKVERMEADADLVNYGKKRSLGDEIDNLVTDEEIEAELRALKPSQKV